MKRRNFLVALPLIPTAALASQEKKNSTTKINYNASLIDMKPTDKGVLYKNQKYKSKFFNLPIEIVRRPGILFDNEWHMLQKSNHSSIKAGWIPKWSSMVFKTQRAIGDYYEEWNSDELNIIIGTTLRFMYLKKSDNYGEIWHGEEVLTVRRIDYRIYEIYAKSWTLEYFDKSKNPKDIIFG